MEYYRKGQVISVGKTYVIFESDNRGSIIYVPDTNQFKDGEILKLFTYKYETDFTSALYGFKTPAEKLLFGDLMELNGIGPKTAIGLLGLPKQALMDSLLTKDSNELSKLGWLGTKTANLIINELSDKYIKLANDPEIKSITKGRGR